MTDCIYSGPCTSILRRFGSILFELLWLCVIFIYRGNIFQWC